MFGIGHNRLKFGIGCGFYLCTWTTFFIFRSNASSCVLKNKNFKHDINHMLIFFFFFLLPACKRQENTSAVVFCGWIISLWLHMAHEKPVCQVTCPTVIIVKANLRRAAFCDNTPHDSQGGRAIWIPKLLSSCCSIWHG